MENCPFCDRAKFEERIITETNDFFVIATLGQITDGGYTLIFPKRHVKCLTALGEEESVQLYSLLLSLQHATGLEYGIFPALFEHGIDGQTVEHAHMHIIPANVDLTEYVKKDYPGAHFSRFRIFNGDVLRMRATEPIPYLLWRPSGGLEFTNILWHPRGVPAQYFRTRLAEALGRPERANWRTMDPELDKRLWSETVARMKKHF